MQLVSLKSLYLTSFAGRGGPDGNKKAGSGVERQPVLLFHGISLSSSCWVINNPHESLAFVLADEGVHMCVSGSCKNNLLARLPFDSTAN